MDQDTLDMLCHPITHEPLAKVTADHPDQTRLEILEAVLTKEQFVSRKGIPVFYDASRLDGYNLYYNTFYHRLAKYYDFGMRAVAFLVGRSETKFRQQYLSQLELFPGCKLLEVSVGTGANLRLLSKDVRLYGLDLSWDMLDKCQRNLVKWGRRAELFYGNAEELPFRDQQFDVVLHVGGINAFNDRGKAIREMVRVAKKGSKVVIADETAKMMEKLAWIPAAKKMLAEWGDRFSPPLHLVPKEMQEVKVEEIVKGYFYLLSFRTI